MAEISASPARRPSLFGLEAEFAVSCDAAEPTSVASAMAHVAKRTLLHLDADKQTGMFLPSADLFYVDGGAHPEWATAEASHPTDTVCHLHAGVRLIARLAEEARPLIREDCPAVRVSRANLDYLGNSWGLHESYLGRKPISAYRRFLLPHVASRLIYSGAGGLDPSSPGVRLSLMPRAAYFTHVSSGNTTESRGLFNTRDEPLSRRGYSRVHLIAGAQDCSQRATWLKMGATALVIALAEEGCTCWPRMDDPLGDMRAWARNPAHRGKVRIGQSRDTLMTAAELQRHLLSLVEPHAGTGQLPEWAGEVCAAWKEAIDLVDSSAAATSPAFDWMIKFPIFRNEARARGYDAACIAAWSDALEYAWCHLADEALLAPHSPDAIDWLCKRQLPRAIQAEAARKLGDHGRWVNVGDFLALRSQLCAIDLRFGDVGSGIFDTLDRQGLIPAHRVATEAQIESAAREAPQGTRARLRGKWVAFLAGQPGNRCAWEGIRHGNQFLDLGDPFTEEAEWKAYVAPPDPLALRSRAYEPFVAGRFAECEALLLEALGIHPSSDILVHLARVCLITDRPDKLVEYAEAAWAARSHAQRYVIGRALWFQVYLAWTTPALDETAVGRALGRVKTLCADGDISHHWTMEPVLEHVAPKLCREALSLLTALHAALSDGDTDRLEALEAWQSATACPLD